MRKPMNNDKARIRLAEAVKPRSIRDYYVQDGAVILDMPNGTSKRWAPDTDANDDYAVLDWARSGHRNDAPQNWTQEEFVKFDRALEDAPHYSCDYEIGDYARAALKVLDTLEQSAERIVDDEGIDGRSS